MDAFGQEWGDFSTLTRKAASNERVEIARKDEDIIIERPHLSIGLSGTFVQFKNMFTDGDNGNFSRYGFYTGDFNRRIRNNQPTKQTRRFKQNLVATSGHLCKLYHQLAEREEPLVISYTPPQWAHQQAILASNLDAIIAHNLPAMLESSNLRSGVLGFRIAMQMTLLRIFSSDGNFLANPERRELSVTDQDFTLGMALANSFLDHAIRLYNILPKQSLNLHSARDRRALEFWDALPEQFKTREALDIGLNKIGVSRRTVFYFFNHLQEINVLTKDKHGNYTKLSSSGESHGEFHTPNTTNSNRSS